MNLNVMHLSDAELLAYLDKHSLDPVVRRLVDIVLTKETDLIQSLVEIGMDGDRVEFCESGDYMSPAEYISHLERDRMYWRDEHDELEQRHEVLAAKKKELENRSIIKIFADLGAEMQELDRGIRVANEQRERAMKEHAMMKDKLSMWAKLNGSV